MSIYDPMSESETETETANEPAPKRPTFRKMETDSEHSEASGSEASEGSEESESSGSDIGDESGSELDSELDSDSDSDSGDEWQPGDPLRHTFFKKPSLRPSDGLRPRHVLSTPERFVPHDEIPEDEIDRSTVYGDGRKQLHTPKDTQLATRVCKLMNDNYKNKKFAIFMRLQETDGDLVWRRIWCHPSHDVYCGQYLRRWIFFRDDPLPDASLFKNPDFLHDLTGKIYLKDHVVAQGLGVSDVISTTFDYAGPDRDHEFIPDRHRNRNPTYATGTQRSRERQQMRKRHREEEVDFAAEQAKKRAVESVATDRAALLRNERANQRYLTAA